MEGKDSSDRPGKWDPNRISFEEGQPHLRNAMKQVGLDPDAQVLTSRDPISREISSLLETPNGPPGFRKWQSPFSLYNPSNAYVTEGEPNAKVPTHSASSRRGLSNCHRRVASSQRS
jgi:hypothetical protein